MAKRAVVQCAFATCDREDVIAALKMPRAIAPSTVIAPIPQLESPLITPTFALPVPHDVADIDHPPRHLA